MTEQPPESERWSEEKEKADEARQDSDGHLVGERYEPSETPSKSEAPQGPPDGGLMAWCQVFCGFSIYLSTWGVANAYGVFQTYYKLGLLADESQSAIAWIGSLQSGLLLLVSFGAGPLFDAGYSRLLLVVGSILTVLGLMMASLASKYWQFMLAQGLATGLGMGLLYLPGISIIPQYFSKRKALALGIASLGSSVGSMIFPPVFNAMEPDVGFGWTMRTIAFIVLALLAPVLALFRIRVAGTSLRRLLNKSLFLDGTFMVFCGAFFFGFMGVYIPFVYVQQYAITVCGTSSNLSAYMLTFLNAGSLFGRVIPNFLADYATGPMNIHIPLAIAATVLAFCWIAIDNTAGIIVFCVLYGFCSGTFVSLGGAICYSLTSDMKTVGTRLGMLTGFCGIGLLIGTPIAGAILDSGGWKGLQAFTGVLMAVSTALMVAARVLKYGPSLAIKC